MDNFHISATGHSLNYLPEYIAKRHGFFAEQNLDVTVSVPRPWDQVLVDIAGGKNADAALGGIWVPAMYRTRAAHHTAFAQLSNRCPLALVRRSTITYSTLSDVKGHTVLIKSGNGASVGLFFKMLLRERGIDPNAVNYVQDLDGVMLTELYLGGMGDFFLVDLVTARILAADNPAFSIAMTMVEEAGDIPWSVYYCETASIDLARQQRFCAALAKGMDFLLRADASSLREELREIFPAIPSDIAVEIVDLYRRNEMWTTVSINKQGYQRWQRGILDGHLIDKLIPFDDLVDSRPLRGVVDPVPLKKGSIRSALT